MIDFDKITPRRGTNCVKWDETEADDVLPLWVADMDFEVAPAIQRALQQRVEHGVFGYTKVPDAYYDAVIRWFEGRHAWTISREWILYTIGVVPAISCVIKALTMPGDKVLIATPVYNCFFSCIRNNGCEVLESPLRINAKGKYEFDWKDFERKCADEKTVAFLLCNPHNPGGRVWTRNELIRIGDICHRHGVTVISDEIHNELVMPNYRYLPFASLSAENEACSVTCISASKSFNIAGLQIANIVCADPALRRRVDRAININEVCDVNPFGVVATIAAYEESEDWLAELRKYISKNYKFLCKELLAIEGVGPVMPLEGTYLAWADCSELCQRLGVNVEQLEQLLIRDAGIYFNAGTHYGAVGEGFMRINLACPRSILAEALQRLARFVAAQS